MEGAYFGLTYLFGQPPNDVMKEEMADLRNKIAQQLASFNQLVQTDVAACNRMAFENGAPTLFAGQPITLAGTATADHEERR